LRPLGFGKTHTVAPQSSVGCGPIRDRGRANATRYAEMPRKATNEGRTRQDFE